MRLAVKSASAQSDPAYSSAPWHGPAFNTLRDVLPLGFCQGALYRTIYSVKPLNPASTTERTAVSESGNWPTGSG